MNSDNATPLLTIPSAAPSKPRAKFENVSESYDGSRAVFRLLRLETWGSSMMNLGYFRYRGPLSCLNVLSCVATAQHRLVMKSVELLHVQGRPHVLDLACGRGKSSFIMHCLNPEAKVVGVDLLDQHVETAQTLYGNARNLSYQPGNAMLLSFEDNSFDRVLCLEAAFHFSDRAQFLREAFRVLRPGGRMVVVDFAWTTDAHRAHRNDPETQLVRQIWQWDDFATVPEYQRMFADVGFRMVRKHDWSGRVTRPIQAQLNCVSALSKTKMGQDFLCWKNPLYRSFSADDWHDCALASKAHGHVVRHSNYMAFVLEKP